VSAAFLLNNKETKLEPFQSRVRHFSCRALQSYNSPGDLYDCKALQDLGLSWDWKGFKVKYNNKTLPFCSEPKFLGVTLKRSLIYRRHLESLRKKLTSRVMLLRRLVGSGWGAGATTLWIATLVLVPQWLIPTSSTQTSTTPSELWLDACVLRQRTTFQSSQASTLLSFITLEPHCL